MTTEHSLLYDYHKHNLNYLNEYIKLADTKAGVALSANLLILGFFGNEARKLDICWNSLQNVGLHVGVLLLLPSLYFFIWKVIWPRYSTNQNQYLSWGGIGSFSNSTKYSQKLYDVGEKKLIEDMGKQNYEIAKVCIKKYKNLKIGFSTMSIGAFIVSLSWFFY